jgi:hypothetical protein
MERGRRIAEIDESQRMKLPSPKPPSARVEYAHAAVPIPMAINPKATWARPFQPVSAVKTA